jgi:ribonuclease P protein component
VATGSQRFAKSHRLRKRPEFLAIQREGRRRSAPHFIVITRKQQGIRPRLGVTTSRKVGSAPARNRVRRLVREFFRRNREGVVGSRDLLVIARSGAAGLSYAAVAEELSRALSADHRER